MTSLMRLACLYCDTEECDGIVEIPPDWADIFEVQSYEEACAEVPSEDLTRSVLEWYTHLGLCPECRQTYG